MINHHSCELFFDDFERCRRKTCSVPEHGGFRVILDSMNAERILIAAECVGDARYFIDKATAYANERVVFDRPIGQNQGVAFPIAEAYAKAQAAALMVERAAGLFDAQEKCAEEANMAKLLAAEASWKAGDICLQDPWRLRLQPCLSHRAQAARNAALPDRADLDQPDPVLSERACARPAEEFLMASPEARPLDGLLVVAVEQGRGRPLLHGPSGPCRRAGHQGGTAGGRLRPPLRHGGDGRECPISPGSTAARNRSCSTSSPTTASACCRHCSKRPTSSYTIWRPGALDRAGFGADLLGRPQTNG